MVHLREQKREGSFMYYNPTVITCFCTWQCREGSQSKTNGLLEQVTFLRTEIEIVFF